MIELTDGVLTLRPLALEDAAAHLAGEDGATARFLSGGESTLQTVGDWIARNRESWRTNGPIRSFGVREASADRLVGMVEANLDLDGVRPGVANITYGIHPGSRGRGFAARAVVLLLEYLRTHTDTAVGMIQVEAENLPSIRIAERAGFRYVGRRVTEPGRCPLTFVRRLR